MLPGPSIAYLLKPSATHPFVTPLVHPAADLHLLQATCAVFQFVMNRWRRVSVVLTLMAKDESLNPCKPKISSKPVQNFVKCSHLNLPRFLYPRNCPALFVGCASTGAEPDIFIWGGHWRGRFCNKGNCQWSVQDFQKETYSAFKRITSLDCTAFNVTSLCFALVTSLVWLESIS